IHLRARIVRLVLDGCEEAEVAEHRQRLTDLWAEKRSREADLARQIPELDLRRQLQGVTVASVARALPPGTALVEIVRVAGTGFPAPDGSGGTGDAPRYEAFLLRQGEAESVRVIDLGDAGAIDGLVTAFLASVVGGAEVRDMVRRTAEPTEGGDATA